MSASTPQENINFLSKAWDFFYRMGKKASLLCIRDEQSDMWHRYLPCVCLRACTIDYYCGWLYDSVTYTEDGSEKSLRNISRHIYQTAAFDNNYWNCFPGIFH